MRKKRGIKVVIAAYNEEDHLPKVLKDLKRYVAKENIIVVDDGSFDNTYFLAKKGGVKALRHPINLGKGAALKTGVEFAFSEGASAIVIMDADGQHDPAEMPLFLSKIQKGSEIIIGVRKTDKKAPFIRTLGNKCASALIHLCFGIYISDPICGYRAFTKEGYDNIRWSSQRYGVETEMIARIGKKKIAYDTVNVKRIYLDAYKGVTILDALRVLLNIPFWLLT